MLIKLQLRKALITNWLMGSFVLILLLSGLFSEFFQAPGTADNEMERYRTLFTAKDFNDIDTFKVENRLGQFSLKKKDNPLKNKWNLTYPRELPASKQTMNNVFETLENIKIRRVYTKDQINLSNFSLNSPLIRIEYTQSNNQDNVVKSENVIISIGLVNPIDGSTYITASNKEAIYQIEPISSSLELIGLSDFVDSKVISLNYDNIQQLELYRGYSNSQQSLMTITRSQDDKSQWLGKTNNENIELDHDKVIEFLESLTNIRSQLILDKRTDELDQAIEQTLQRPQYTFKIFDQHQNIITYETSSILSQNLPDLRLEPNESFVIRASNREHPYIVHKNSLDIFETRQENLEKLPIDKLFY